MEQVEKKVDVKAGKNDISDETMEYVGILAKLELSKEEKAAAADYYIADFIQMPDDCKRKLIL